MHPVIDRETAIMAGLKKYFTGEPCLHGHIAPRRTHGSACTECGRIQTAAYYALNRDACRARQSEYFARPKVVEAMTRRVAEWQAKNPAKVLATKARYRDGNREALRAKNREYHKANPHFATMHAAERRVLGRAATPKWVDRDAIKAIYRCAREISELSGIEHSVDHVIPLKHKLVCGLHVPWNLQVMTAVANKQKANKFNPEDFE